MLVLSDFLLMIFIFQWFSEQVSMTLSEWNPYRYSFKRRVSLRVYNAGQSIFNMFFLRRVFQVITINVVFTGIPKLIW